MSISKRIAIVVDTLHGGGAEKVCILLAKSLLNMQVDVDLIVVKPLCEYEIGDMVNVRFLLQNADAKLYKKNVIQQAVAALLEIVDDVGGYDLVLSNLDGSHPIVSKAGLPNSWYVVHNSVKEKLARALRLGPIKYYRQKSVYNILNNKNIVAVSKGLETELLESKHVRPAKVVQIYNPVDTAGIQVDGLDQKKLPDEPYIIHVGRFARLKRHDILFEAYNYLTMVLNHHVKLVLLCEDSKKLRALVKKHKLEERVIIAGFQQNPYLWMKKAEALVLSSDGEGFGLVLVEAMLCGTSVVSTNCNHGPSEILGDKFSRYLSPVGDPVALAKNIDNVLKEKPNYESLDIFKQVYPIFAASRYLDLLNYEEDFGRN